MGKYWYRFTHNGIKSQVLVQSNDENQARYNGLTIAKSFHPNEIIEGLELEKVDTSAWNKVQEYIDHCNYTWTFEQLKEVYQKYHENGFYTSYTFRDILKEFPSEMNLLFHS